MANFLDYLRWRGDLSFTVNPLNEVDAAILATISYLPIEQYLKYRSSIKLGDIAKLLLNNRQLIQTLDQQTQLTLQLIIYSPRFADINVIDYMSKSRQNPAMQFTAVTFRIRPHQLIISYRGTDHTMIGWSEDMTMSYSNKIEGQQVAAKYLAEQTAQHPHSKFILTGHSKGGNFAIYAGAYTPPSVQSQIKQIYNFDGPGFVQEIMATPGFQAIIEKVRSFVPQGSIFGLMLNHSEPLNIIKSDKKILLQHNPVTWNVVRNSFVKVDKLKTSSNIIDQAIKDWLEDVPPDQREALWSSLFDAFAEINITQVDQLMRNKFIGALQLSKAYLALNPATRLVAHKIIDELVQNIRRNIPNVSPFNNKTD
ncbi:hypothetical protein FC62_GL001163 [Amylolactobacillus amylotrophicus DSM 20534]|uniref:Uncharacterized protein n=4 Tax=Amylolactobacillus TaxID=2767876 RepID=A0A1L6XBY6_9LACO|nr:MULTISPECIES: Mbeg1-like protein [Amylolactobacillus]APT18490.1 hypothetical protein LA20533_04075 [Amylolactobacillus amylophilus DSM 20533 = JCM 1125]KRK37551.1 hypothetical protein FC62_GL001163 [Amylolactobacillus amylotrophicus DSM 20534]KRM43527.1 hypothetical protein FD40_GL001470 [Amylolactobacillus amylophilus DSM 20533 = JCM 1125]GED80383.1 hypothetical protein LAM01_08560 [Amylolactobacillus amylophilus]